MKNRLQFTLLLVSGSLLLLILGFLAISLGWFSKTADAQPEPATPTGQIIDRSNLANAPPPPKTVGNPDRVRKNLQPGKTYQTHTEGTLHVRAEDKDWGIGKVVTVNYGFEAFIDRTIESNDGTLIVELRHFRDVRSLKVDTLLEDLRIELGEAGDSFLVGLSALATVKPEVGVPAAALVKVLDGASMKKVLSAMRWAGVPPEKVAGLDEASIKMFAKVDQLNGKSVRITYRDGRGVLKLEPVHGEMTAAERDFHFAGVLLSDPLIIPNVDIPGGIRWTVDGSNFANVIDPALLARAAGEVVLERGPDHLVQNKICRHIRVVEGRILLEDSDRRQSRVGHFDPQGSLFFSPTDQVIIEARLKGKAELKRVSKDHLLFEARMRRLPEVEVKYTCRVIDTPRGK